MTVVEGSGTASPPTGPIQIASADIFPAVAVSVAQAGLRLHCHGVVQGVGFRPTVRRLAASLGLRGTLTNLAGVVRLELAGARAALEHFLVDLPVALLPPARLERLEVQWLEVPLPPDLSTARGLSIAAAAPRPLGEGWFTASLSADLAPCPDCLAELRDPLSRRFRYPFLSCSGCGPRYSIATAEPWCRAHTTLAAFPLCPACRREFEDPADRRFHAETIACPVCGPRLSLALAGPSGGFNACHDDDLLARAAALLRAGGILALQGVGGFQLLVDASDAGAVQRLRRRKRRPGRPFALLVAEEAPLEDWVRIDPLERQWLHHPAAPIVLLRRHLSDGPEAAPALAAVAPGSEALGVMRPASPLHQLLAEAVGRPLVCTSGNRSGEPLCLEAPEALERLAGIADAVLHHDRPIARRLDDSLLQVVCGRMGLLRRARGFCPEPLSLPGAAGGEGRGVGDGGLGVAGNGFDAAGGAEDGGHGDGAGRAGDNNAVLALGGDLKSAPALAWGDQAWLAPHLGDLADARTQSRLRRGLQEQLQRPMPALVALACDAHPGYVSGQLAGATALPQWRVPHHLAHGLAVVAEQGLVPPLLLVAFDGLGYGAPEESVSGTTAGAAGRDGRQEVVAAAGAAHATPGPGDGRTPAAGAGTPDALPLLRGGEVLLLDREGAGAWRARTAASLLPFPLPGAERAMREPRRAALGLLHRADLLDHPGAWRLERAFAAGDRPLLLQALQAGCQAPLCSSAGRLFDAAASLLGLVQVLHDEGEGGLKLQGAASRGLDSCPVVDDALLPLLPLVGGRHHGLDWRPLLRGLLERSVRGGDRHRAAAWFHLALAEGLAASLAELARRLALPTGGPRLVLSGGCFQNRLLLQSTHSALERRGLGCCWSQAVPCNDGGLALGQLWAVRHGLAAAAADRRAP